MPRCTIAEYGFVNASLAVIAKRAAQQERDRLPRDRTNRPRRGRQLLPAGHLQMMEKPGCNPATELLTPTSARTWPTSGAPAETRAGDIG
jgi:hypothetical protein